MAEMGKDSDLDPIADGVAKPNAHATLTGDDQVPLDARLHGWGKSSLLPGPGG